MTKLTADQNTLVDAVIDGQVDRVELVAASIPERELILLVNALFVSAVWDKFPEDPTSAEIAEFARSATRALAEMNPRQLIFEAVVRGALGDYGATRSIDANDSYSAKLVLSVFYFTRFPPSDETRRKVKNQVAETLAG